MKQKKKCLLKQNITAERIKKCKKERKVIKDI